jgi:hypothetical protein
MRRALLAGTATLIAVGIIGGIVAQQLWLASRQAIERRFAASSDATTSILSSALTEQLAQVDAAARALEVRHGLGFCSVLLNALVPIPFSKESHFPVCAWPILFPTRSQASPPAENSSVATDSVYAILASESRRPFLLAHQP